MPMDNTETLMNRTPTIKQPLIEYFLEASSLKSPELVTSLMKDEEQLINVSKNVSVSLDTKNTQKSYGGLILGVVMLGALGYGIYVTSKKGQLKGISRAKTSLTYQGKIFNNSLK
jgi:hypothetical protein